MLKIVLLQVAFLLLVSCSGGKGSKSRGNSFYMNLKAEPTTLNPITSTDGYSGQIQGEILESLLSRDIDTFKFRPALSTEWRISKDKKTFLFKIRQGVKWHDGKPFTVEDVKFSFDVLFDDRYNAAHLRPYYEGISKVEIVDDSTVKFHAKSKYFQNFNVAAGLQIVPKHLYENPENMKKLNRVLIGTGPYILKKYDKGKRIILVKNKDWWGNTEPHYKDENNFEKIGYRFIGEATVALEMLKKGTIDYYGLEPEDYVKKTSDKVWKTDLVKVKTVNKSSKGYNFYGWNLKNKLFKSRKLRRALAHLVNRPLMLDKFQYNMAEYATGPQYIQSDYASKKVKPLLYDPAKALALLKEDGWSDSDGDQILDKVIDGRKTKLSFTVLDPYAGFMKYNTIFKEDARKVGVDVNFKIVEWNSFIKLVDERKFDAVRMAWGGVIDWDPKQIWHSSSIKNGSNFISYNNKKIDRLIDTARETYDRSKRVKLLQEIYEIIADDAPYAFFFNSKYVTYGHNKRLAKPKDTFTYGVGVSYWSVAK